MYHSGSDVRRVLFYGLRRTEGRRFVLAAAHEHRHTYIASCEIESFVSFRGVEFQECVMDLQILEMCLFFTMLFDDEEVTLSFVSVLGLNNKHF